MIKGRMSDVLINMIRYDITARILTHFWTIILSCIKDKGVKITRSVPKGVEVTNFGGSVNDDGYHYFTMDLYLRP